MRDYVLRMDRFGISRDRLRELRAICRQYDDMQSELNRIRMGTVDPPKYSRNSPGSIYKDPTGNAAARAADSWCRSRISAINKAATEADPDLWQYILKNVTRDIPYAHLGIPCGQNQFYKMRRKFYWILDKLL